MAQSLSQPMGPKTTTSGYNIMLPASENITGTHQDQANRWPSSRNR